MAPKHNKRDMVDQTSAQTSRDNPSEKMSQWRIGQLVFDLADPEAKTSGHPIRPMARTAARGSMGGHSESKRKGGHTPFDSYKKPAKRSRRASDDLAVPSIQPAFASMSMSTDAMESSFRPGKLFPTIPSDNSFDFSGVPFPIDLSRDGTYRYDAGAEAQGSMGITVPDFDAIIVSGQSSTNQDVPLGIGDGPAYGGMPSRHSRAVPNLLRYQSASLLVNDHPRVVMGSYAYDPNSYIARSSQATDYAEHSGPFTRGEAPGFYSQYPNDRNFQSNGNANHNAGGSNVPNGYSTLFADGDCPVSDSTGDFDQAAYESYLLNHRKNGVLISQSASAWPTNADTSGRRYPPYQSQYPADVNYSPGPEGLPVDFPPCPGNHLIQASSAGASSSGFIAEETHEGWQR